MKLGIENLKWFVENDGNVSIGSFGAVRCAAVANDRDNMIAALEKRNDESIEDLLNRLDKAINLALEEGEFIDEINKYIEEQYEH